MNLKKSLIRTVVMGAVLAGVTFVNSSAQASTDATGKLLKMNIPTYRNSGYAYQAGLESSSGIKEQSMWKIYQYNSNGQTIINQNNGIYCLKMGVGFGSEGGSETQQRVYNVYADMKNPGADQSIINSYISNIPSAANYNAIVWILDHAYVPAPTNSPTAEQTANAAAAKRELLTAAGIPSSTISDDLIDIVQQIAIWYFSNNDQYKANTITSVDAKTTTTDWNSIDDVFDNFELADDVDALYEYFINGGNANKSTVPSATAINPISLTSEGAKINTEGNYYIAGPYRITDLATGTNYTLTGSLKSSSGSSITYTLLDSNKQATSKTLKQLIGEDFYLRIPSSANVEQAIFNVSASVKQNTITYWTVTNANNDQPVAIVEPETKTYNAQATLSLSEFDLALRKFITKINDVAVEVDRTPVVTAETITNLKNRATKTVTKTHTKTPLEVKTGDTVLYTIRIYNEGTMNGYATEITDYLPSGLKLKEGSTINTQNGWTNPSGDGKTIVSTKLANTLLQKFNGTEVKYADLQIECTVTAGILESTQSLKNIAEITADADENKNEVTDRDSTPKNLTEAQKNNYNPGTSEQGWGYQDDDDYEELVMPGKYFDLALRKFITKINGENVEVDRTPKITEQTITDLKNGTTKTATKTHTKTPLRVETGDTVLYTIRIYNEGELSGYATEVTDYLPTGLKLKEGSSINTENGWTNPSGDGKTIVTTKLANRLLNKFNGTTIDYADLQVECSVIATTTQTNQSLKNIAEITADADENKNEITDRDSTPKNLTDNQKNNYNPTTSERGIGYEDDDDYEELILPGKYFDLALRKFITKINGENVEVDRTPQITEQTITELKNGRTETTTKTHTKAPLRVETGDTVLYTIRVYNEGELSGYATEVTDYLPTGLTLKEGSSINAENGWTNPSGDGKTIVTTKLADRLLNKFNGTTIDYADLQVECSVVATTTQTNQSLKNIAEITADADENKNEITDRDSTPKNLTDNQKNNYNPGTSEQGWGYEDDDDYEELVLPGKYFDLALRKFITKINGENVEVDRTPAISNNTLNELNSGATETATKTHTKTPLKVNIGDTVIYTIRVYNEGELSGYAAEVTDYLPAGLTLKEESEINEEYGWTNPNGDGRTIITEKLKDTLLKKFDGKTLDYADLQIECIVDAPVTQEQQSLKNVAEITKALDENKNEVTDRDSTPEDLTNQQKENYNPGTSEQGWGYEDDDDYEELVLPGKEFDLALRKYITNINGKELKDEDGTYLREPDIDLTPLKNGTDTTAIYKHPKNPIGVAIGDIVIYTLRIYNEGEIDGYANSVTDYLPPQLEFVNDEFNAGYGWVMDVNNSRKITTNYLQKPTIDPEDTLIKAFDGTTLDYKELKIKCKVVATANLDKVITNIAEVTDFTDANGNAVIDRDSQKANVVLPSDEDLPDYKGNSSNKSILTDKDYFYKGQQDDDDFEKLILEQFDLALRKFITKVNETEVTTRIPKFTNVKDSNGNYIYEHTKEPVEVESTDIVEYTLRIYNEGDIAGYAKEIKDDIPAGLEFLPENNTNKEYRWIMIDKDGNKTDDSSKAVSITTDYLSKEQEKTSGANLIEPFNNSKTSPDYKEVKVAFKVIALNTYEGIITNIAQISDDSDENGNPVDDKDSTPDNDNPKEDDIDVEHIKLKYFDLALRKFITAVNDTEVTNRVPVFKVTDEGKYVYEHTKEPVEVTNGDIVTYTLRIYNEGTMAGYAKEVKDDLPEGLLFLPDNDTNKEYRWVMLDEDGKETDDVTKAVSIKTDYLSKEQEDATSRNNLLKAFDVNTMKEPDYREIKIAFKVTEPNTSDRILINKAQISDDSDKDGKPVIDIDSTPDKWNEGEDDQDIEKVKVKYFDLALRKWVTQAIVIDNGKQTVTETGHKAEDDPEAPVKVEIKEGRLNKVVVKFRYKIRITNEGEIAGYATEISDYIPQGLKFVAADNPDWKEVDGKIVTEKLKNTLLKPGETAEVEVLLTWINGKNNFGLKVNTAEISKDKNDSNTPDIDSTPNNKKPKEDDIDDAPVLLSIKTGAGEVMQYVALAIGSLTILSSGVILIKKFVL